MIDDFRLGVIGGTGWMGSAILRSILEHSSITPDQILVSNSSGAALAGYPDVKVYTDSQALVDASDCVILSVRPNHFPALSVDLTDQLVISIMAGVTIDAIHKQTGAEAIIRAMPNAAAEIGQSYTPYVNSDGADVDFESLAMALFNSFGTTGRLQSEDELNYFVALTGSGHGTLAYLADALIQAALQQGIDESLAQRGVRQLFKGMGELVAGEANTPAQTVQRVTEYGGTTCRLVETLAHEGVDKGIKNALQACYARASENMQTD